MRRLLAAAERRQRTCHDELRAFLGSAEFRRLGVELACLAGGPGWPGAPDDAEQTEPAAPLEAFAADVLEQAAEASWYRSTTTSPAWSRPRCTRSACARSGCAMRRRSSRRSIPGKADASLHPPAEPAAGSTGHTERRRGRGSTCSARSPAATTRSPSAWSRASSARATATRASRSTRHGRSSIGWSRSGHEVARAYLDTDRPENTGPRLAAGRRFISDPKRHRARLRRRRHPSCQQLEARQRP